MADLSFTGLSQDIAATGRADRGPHEPEPLGHPTAADPDAPPSDRAGLGAVVQDLAATDGPFGSQLDAERWPDLARAVLAAGGAWPAAAELAAADPADEPGIVAAVERLAGQVRAGLGGRVRGAFLDASVGLVARAWRLGVIDVTDAIALLDAVWWDRDRAGADAPRGDGWEVVRTAMKIVEVEGFQDTHDVSVALLSGAERLIPPYSVNASFCTAFLDAFQPLAPPRRPTGA